jgi:CRISPR-associated protein Csb1
VSSREVFDSLIHSLQSGAVAIRAITELQPTGGKGDKVLPPTYENGTYAKEKRHWDGKEIECVLLDSPQSQANRLEELLLAAHRSGKLDLPVLEVNIPGHEPVTSLTAPHRIHDAILRDSLLNSQLFRQSDVGKRIGAARAWNATAFYEYAPTVLLFGSWDSQSGSGVNSAKVPRSLVSEITALDVIFGVKTSSRIDPLGIRLVRDVIAQSSIPGEIWRFQEPSSEAKKVKKGGSNGSLKPSEINHGNVTPTITKQNEPGGVSFEKAIQTTVLSLTQLRRLRFLDENGTSTEDRDTAGRAVIAALGLCAITLLWEDGFQLRSRCQLIPADTPEFQVLGRTANDATPFPLDSTAAIQLLKSAVAEAAKHRLIWHPGTIELQPRPDLLKLVQYSDSSVAAPLEGE